MVRESMKYWLLTIVLGLSTVLLAKDKSYDEFLKNIKEMQGEYELVKGSKSCSDGSLALFNESNVEEGFRLGHHIFFGALNSSGDEKSDNCSVNSKYSFTANSITLTTEVSRCPASLKAEESVSTKYFNFKNGRVYYSVKETGFNCEYKKVATKGGE